jgi:hypothetical protein
MRLRTVRKNHDIRFLVVIVFGLKRNLTSLSESFSGSTIFVDHIVINRKGAELIIVNSVAGCNIIKSTIDINLCSLLQQIIVESIPLFQDHFFELFLCPSINPRPRLDRPNAKSVLFSIVVVINTTVVIRVTWLRTQSPPLSLKALMKIWRQLAKLVYSPYRHGLTIVVKT